MLLACERGIYREGWGWEESAEGGEGLQDASFRAAVCQRQRLVDAGWPPPTHCVIPLVPLELPVSACALCDNHQALRGITSCDCAKNPRKINGNVKMPQQDDVGGMKEWCKKLEPPLDVLDQVAVPGRVDAATGLRTVTLESVKAMDDLAVSLNVFDDQDSSTKEAAADQAVNKVKARIATAMHAIGTNSSALPSMECFLLLASSLCCAEGAVNTKANTACTFHPHPIPLTPHAVPCCTPCFFAAAKGSLHHHGLCPAPRITGCRIWQAAHADRSGAEHSTPQQPHRHLQELPDGGSAPLYGECKRDCGAVLKHEAHLWAHPFNERSTACVDL